MSTGPGNDPFSGSNNRNLLQHIISPKIVSDGSGGYVVKTDLINIDNVYLSGVVSNNNIVIGSDGTATGPSLYWAGDADTGFWHPAANTIGISTNATEKLRIDATGAVILSNNGTATGPSITWTGDPGAGMWHPTIGSVAFSTNSTEKLRINATGAVILTNEGTATAPSIVWTGDLDTGIWHPAANTVAITTNASERLRVDATGAVILNNEGTATGPTITWTGDTDTGIWHPAANTVAISTNATQKLRIDATGAVILTNEGTATGPALTWNGDLDTGIWHPTDNAVCISTNGTEKLRVDSVGAVIINNKGSATGPIITWDGDLDTGIWSPFPNSVALTAGGIESLRTVNDGTIIIRNNGTATGPVLTWTNDFDTGILHPADNTVAISTNASEKLRVDATGAVILSNSGTATGPTITWTGDTDTGIWRPAANTLAFSTNALERMRISATGPIGIGTTTPSNLLDITTDARSGTQPSSLALYVTKAGGSNIDPVATFGHSNGTQSIGIGWNSIVANGSNASQDLTFYNKAGTTYFYDSTGPTERMRISTNGTLLLGATGAAAAPSLTWLGDPDTGMYHPGDNLLALSTNGVERVRIGSTGAVGINISSATGPAASLEVGSTLRVTDTLGGRNPRIDLSRSAVFDFGTGGILDWRIQALNIGGLFQLTKQSSTIGPTGALTIDPVNNWVSVDANGTAAGPSLVWVGDINTGFWHPTEDTLAASTAGSERWRIDSSGNVGIGTTAPTQARLSVNGSSTFSTGASSTYYSPTGAVTITPTNVALSVYATNNYGGAGFYAFSDERIKENVQDVTDSSALDTLRQIQPKTYEYVDKVSRGTKRVYGFIAQQVEPLIENSVYLNVDFVPNIYKFGQCTLIESTQELTSGPTGPSVAIPTNTESEELVSGPTGPTDGILPNIASEGILVMEADAVQLDLEQPTPHLLKLFDEQNKETIVELREIIDSKTFKIYGYIRNYRYFVYGQQVNNFRVLNKDSIFTVGVAALQEVDRQLQDTKTRLSSLEERVSQLESRFN